MSPRRAGNRLPDNEFRDLIDKARDRHLISDIVGRHTALKKRGARELVGLCCFHQERTPSLEVNDGKGTYHCHGCGAGGDAIRFLMNAEGMTFRQSVETLLGEEFPVISEEDRAQRKAEDARLAAERLALARSIWDASVPPIGTPAEVYAHARGITAPLPPTIRFVMTPRYRNTDTGEVGPDHPAMVCALQDWTDAVVGVQCIFLQDGGTRKYQRIRQDGTKAKAKLTFGTLVGAALRLGPLADHLIVTEGPEDGLTLMQWRPDKSIWASCGTANLAQIGFPCAVESVCFAGDNGEAGHAAVNRAREAALASGLRVSETFPSPEFKDWNDQLRGIRA